MKQDAVVIMKKVIELDPPNSKVWFEAACLADEMCDYDLALGYLEKAIQLDSMNTLIFHKKAEILTSLKRYCEALKTLQDTIELCN
jgi:tetratricopeptide (TPR) repeat protein